MYTQEDYEKNRLRIRNRTLVLTLPSLILVGLIVWSFILRVKWATMALTILLGAGIIFSYGMFLFPLIAYGRHLRDALTGRTRQITGAFKEMEKSPVQREGVMYYPMLLSVGDPEEPEDDRLFYYDASVERPAFSQGETLTVTAHDKFVTAWSRP